MDKSYTELLDKIKYFYDVVGPKYSLIYPDIERNNGMIVDSLIRQGLIKPFSSTRIADVACSCGWLVKQLYNKCPAVNLFGFDISDISIDIAKRKLKEGDGRVLFDVADWLNIHKKLDGELDIVLCLGNSITHFSVNVQIEILKSFSGFIKKDGYLILDTYKNWINKFKTHKEIEPKGLTRIGGKDIFSCIFSVYDSNLVERNIIFVTYDAIRQSENTPDCFENYIIYQYPFCIYNGAVADSIGFSSIKKIIIQDGTGLFEYYLLKK